MITVPLELQSDRPLYEQIYQYLKEEITEGVLPEQTKLPSARGLASHLQVSRNTVDLAYDQLVSEGYIASVPRKGYYVCDIGSFSGAGQAASFSISDFPVQEHSASCSIDFNPFSVNISHFPYSVWRKLTREVLEDNTGQLFLQGDKQGDLSLRQAIASYLHQSRGVCCSPEQIIVGAGADYLLQLLSQLLDQHASIAMENPTYRQAYDIFRGFGFTCTPVSVDSSGMNVEALTSSSCRYAYITPSHQYPLGIVMPVKRRTALLSWAEEVDGYLIEDDHDSEFRYKGKPIASLQGIDTGSRVVYMGTFSKSIAPAIRVGYMLLPPPLLSLYRSRYSYYSCTVSRIDQNILALFLERGHFERHINRMRKLYRSRHDALLEALQAFQNHIYIQGENAGLHLLVTIRTAMREQDLIDAGKAAGIRLYGLSDHYIAPVSAPYPSLLFGYANLSEEEIRTGIALFYQIMKDRLL